MLQKLGWGHFLRISGEWTWNIKQILNIDFSIFDSVFERKKENMAGWNTDDVIHGGLILFMKPFRFLTLKN